MRLCSFGLHEYGLVVVRFQVSRSLNTPGSVTEHSEHLKKSLIRIKCKYLLPKGYLSSLNLGRA